MIHDDLVMNNRKRKKERKKASELKKETKFFKVFTGMLEVLIYYAIGKPIKNISKRFTNKFSYNFFLPSL